MYHYSGTETYPSSKYYKLFAFVLTQNNKADTTQKLIAAFIVSTQTNNRHKSNQHQHKSKEHKSNIAPPHQIVLLCYYVFVHCMLPDLAFQTKVRPQIVFSMNAKNDINRKCALLNTYVVYLLVDYHYYFQMNVFLMQRKVLEKKLNFITNHFFNKKDYFYL